MHSFKEFSLLFSEKFNQNLFTSRSGTLYEAGNYFLELGGKRIRPVLCLMGNELFDELNPDSWQVATAVELFHNFTLVHDDIMDKAALRRGQPTVHEKFGHATALLSGDMLLVLAYEQLNQIKNAYLKKILQLFNQTAREVCDGQQLDMEFESATHVHMDEYLRMIELKTSVLLAAALQMGAILGGAGAGNQKHLYEFGKNLGIAFQIQDDYLDAFGDPEKFGKQPGGDIKANKKTFLMIRTLEIANEQQRKELKRVAGQKSDEMVTQVLNIFKSCGVDKWAEDLKEEFYQKAMQHLDDIAVLENRKGPLKELSKFLIQRDH